MKHHVSGRLSLLALVTALAAGCGTGPDRLHVSGDWQGSAQLPNEFSTSLTIIQSGATVSGTMTIAGSFIDQTLVGNLDESSRTLTWTVFDGCEKWSGTFTVDSDGTGMSGPVLHDLSACSPPGSNVSGTISLSKQ